MNITKSDQCCGAVVTNIDLSKPLELAQVEELKNAWYKYQVLSFAEQKLDDKDLLRFTKYFGSLGEDPYFNAKPGSEHIVEIKRLANETSSIFAESWHTDWSFQQTPPAGTCLYAKIIPPVGGDTLFSNQVFAYDAMACDMKDKYSSLQAVHSAAAGYAPDGLYGESDSADRSMQITYSKQAKTEQVHPLVKTHPFTNHKALFGCVGYISRFEGMSKQDSDKLLLELYQWQTREEFIYTHKWEKDMLLLWDNRSVLHRATGGYEGYDRLLHRLTVA